MLDVRSFCFKMVGPTHPAIALNTQGRREISVKNSASCNTAKSLGSMPSSVPDELPLFGPDGGPKTNPLSSTCTTAVAQEKLL